MDSVRFGSSDVLMAELSSTGLAGLGVTGPDFFWEKIINPAWIEGSTTGVGYASLMERRLKEILPETVKEESLRRAVKDFTQRYFASFKIDRRWMATLRHIQDDSRLSALVTTDHYAEATGAIIGSLSAMGIKARRLDESHDQGDYKFFVVANSADLGFSKAQRCFWEFIISRFPSFRGTPILLVDDFGFNEAYGSSYGEWQRVVKRRDETVALLEEVFESSTRVISFFPHEGPRSGERVTFPGETFLNITGMISIVEEAVNEL